LGKKKFDARGAVGTNHYENLVNIDSMDDLPLGSVIIGFDDVPKAKPIDSYLWNKSQHIIMCFGQESVGLTENVLSRCNEVLYIRQYGSVRSLNVGCASAIAMFSYCQQLIGGQRLEK